MPIFGQVWLWSSLAFLLGAVLCWLLVARPARNRVGELEAQLATRARRQSAGERPEQPRRKDGRNDEEAEFSRALVPGLGDRPDGEDSEYLTRSYALRDTPPPLPPERDPLGRYEDREPGSPGRDFAPLPPEREPEPSLGGFDGGLSAPPEPSTELTQSGPSAAATQYLDVSAGSLTAPPEVPPMSPPPSDRGWFDDELEGDAANQAPEEQPALPRNRHQLDESLELNDSRLVDDDVDAIGDALDDEEEDEESRPAVEDDGGTVFTQRTHPIPGELIRRIDEEGKAEQAERAEAESTELADDFVDDLADEPGDEVAKHERTVESEPVAPGTPPAAQEAEKTGASHALVEPEPEVASAEELRQERTEVVAAVAEKPANDLPRRVPKQNRITPGVAVRVEPTPSASALPKRVPGKPRHQVPFGVQPSSTPEPAPAAAVVDEVPDTPRSLFEPIVPAADEGTSTPPPPHRLRQGSGGGRGPFGPGSAMPLPGGASPSPEFTIKASVAALRYCTPDSPQFGRTVAEVWFRTAADAERVGFRPVG
ncbi:sunset domain-containing protein [Actinophytocola sp. KF-1]